MTTQRSFRRMGLATALALALTAAACGDDPNPVATTGGLASPEVIHVAGAGSGDGRVAAEAASADLSMIAPWYIADYVVTGTLPAMPSDATGWRFAPGAIADEATVRRVADALDVQGELVAVGADLGGGWRVGPDDGSAASLYVSADGQLSWWYSPAWAAGPRTTGVSCAVPEPALVDPAEGGGSSGSGGAEVSADSFSDGDVPTTDGDVPTAEPDVPADCVFEEIQPPAGVPTSGEAEARARELLAELGVDAGSLTFEVYADEWSASVTAYRSFGGVRSTVGYSFGFGENGRLDWASGVLAEPVEVGPYPLVSVDVALERLRDGFYGWAQPGVLAARSDLALDAPVDSLGAPEIDPAACAADGPDCFPEPEPITVNLVDVRMDLWMVWDVDGTVWLLPAFAFVADDGSVHVVPAVADEFLAVEEPVAEGPPTEPAPGESVPTEPGGVPGETPAAPPAEPGDPEILPAPGNGGITASEAEVLLGLGEAEATDLAVANGWAVRVVARDGDSFPATADYSPTRVNLTIESGTVSAVSIG